MSWLKRRPKIMCRRFFLEPLEERIVLDATVSVDPVQAPDSAPAVESAGLPEELTASDGFSEQNQQVRGADSEAPTYGS
ncbi:MAG: hypothetical protein V2B18_17305, partial [Pseudomonadota bacterium]